MRVVEPRDRDADDRNEEQHALYHRRLRELSGPRAKSSAVGSGSVSPSKDASFTADAVPSRGGATPFFLTMFNIVTGFLLALDGNSDLESCLSHVGTEGFYPA